ncbi:MAG: trigger factor [Candidatus Paceibacterota bacterium]|jgi:FKBP-type peptidyl-prolyl cis-trans isomerase (trigger factor)
MNQTTNNAPKIYDNLAIKNLDNSMIEISASIATDQYESFRPQALKNLNDSITIDGFRKGMVPENVLITKVGEAAILEEIAELALSKAYVAIVIDNKLNAIGKPQVQVTKLAKGNPMEFKATTAIIPEIKLPEYKKLSATIIKKRDSLPYEVTDKDVEDTILRIRKSHVSHDKHDHDKLTPEEHEKMILDSLPEFNDDFVRGLGGEFDNVEDFKIKIREMIGESKKDEAREKLRLEIADALTSATSVVLPEIMIESELNRTQTQFEADIEKMGVKLDDYLKHAKKTLTDIRKEWRPHAEKKAKLQLILNAIAEAEQIAPDPKEIEVEVNHIVKHYKDADRDHATVYAETILTNEKVFAFLEK